MHVNKNFDYMEIKKSSVPAADNETVQKHLMQNFGMGFALI